MPPTSAAPSLNNVGTAGTSGLTAQPLQSGILSKGIFLGFLSQIGLNGGNIDSNTTHPQFGKAGFNVDPAMLVLPPGVSTLSESALKAYLAAQAKEAGLSDTILAAMTAGIPQATAPNDILNGDITLPANVIGDTAWGHDPVFGNIDSEGANNIFDMEGCLAPELCLETQNTALLDQFFDGANIYTPHHLPETDLTGADDTSAAPNPLLIATGLSPAQIEAFQQELIDSKDKESTDANMAMVLVNFVVPDNKSFAPEVNLNEMADSSAKHDFFRPLHPFEIQKLAENMNDGADEDAGYIAGFAQHNGFANSVANSHAASNAQGNTNNATATLDNVSQFFLAAAPSSSDAYGLVASLGAQNPLTQNTASSSAILYNSNATSTHPATQLVAATLTKAAGKSDKEQTLSLELDPPELGRVQIHLSYEKGEPLKVRVLTEKQETLTLLQRDAHALKSALDDAGIKADGSSLSFDMAGGDQSFNQMLGQFHDQQSNRSANRFSLSGTSDNAADSGMAVTIETHLTDVPSFGDNSQGYSFLA